MRPSLSSFRQLARLALVALPLLLLLGLNGRAVSVLRPLAPGETQVSAAPHAIIKQKVVLEAALPLSSYVAPALALGWLPGTLPASWSWVPRWRRRAVVPARAGASAAFAAQWYRARLLGAALAPQAP